MAQLPDLSRLLLGDDRAVVPLGTALLKRWMEENGRTPQVWATATATAHPPADW